MNWARSANRKETLHLLPIHLTWSLLLEIVKMNLDHLYDKNGAVEPNKLKTLGEEDKNYIIDLTSFLQNEPTISQRLRCLQLKITEHEKCEFCHVYLRYSPHKHELFKKVCTCDGYKNSPRKRNEIKARIEKFNETIDNRNKNFTPAPILEYESLREILKKHICVETYTQYVIQNVLYKIPGVKESLFYYEPHGRISYKIAKILYGQGYCEKCAAETRFLSIENGFSKYCQRCGGAMAKSQNALKNAVDLLIMAGYTIVHRPNSIQNTFTLMCQRGHTFERRFNNGRINSDLTKLCQYCYPRTISSYEFEIKNFLEANGIDAVQQYPIHKYKNGVTRTDLFLPNYNIAIEFNGLMWHSYGKSKTSRFNNHADEKYDKHLCKTIMCENLGIELLHIFENEWLQKQDIWKSTILSKCNKTEKIHSRLCDIRIIDDDTYKAFMNDNHLEGYIKADYTMGLFHDDQLVAAMAFSKKPNDFYELIRFASKCYVTVIGGFSKLLKFFIKRYSTTRIITHADRRWSNDDVYKKVGFELTKIQHPRYWYIPSNNLYCPIDQLHKHKFEDSYDKESFDLMLDIGYRRIWDCGVKTYTLINNICNF